MGEENNYTLVVEWCYKDDTMGRKIIPVLYNTYDEALQACNTVCNEELSHFEKVNGEGTVEKLLQTSVPFEPFYEMWCISGNDENDPCAYIVRPVIVPSYMQAIPNMKNGPLSSYISNIQK